MVGRPNAVVGSQPALTNAFYTSVSTADCLFSLFVLTGTGTGIQYLASTIRIQESFEKNRALATGIAASGGGIGMIVISAMRAGAINTVGWQKGLLFELVFVGISIPVVSFLRDKQPDSRHISTDGCTDYGTSRELDNLQEDISTVSEAHQKKCSALRSDNLAFLTHPLFYFSLIIIILLANEAYTTSYYLPSLARLDNGLTSDQASWLILISGVAGIPGRIVVGYIGSHSLLTRALLYFIVNLITAITTCLVQYLTSFPLLVLYAILLGIMGGELLQP